MTVKDNIPGRVVSQHATGLPSDHPTSWPQVGKSKLGLSVPDAGCSPKLNPPLPLAGTHGPGDCGEGDTARDRPACAAGWSESRVGNGDRAHRNTGSRSEGLDVMTTPTPTEALTNLRRVVAAAPDDRFHMRAVTEESTCGTAHCAFGWALVDPWFQENTPLGKFADWPHRHFPSEGMVSYSKLRKIFGLTDIAFSKLFAGDASGNISAHAITKAEVLANIDRLLAGEHPLTYKALRS